MRDGRPPVTGPLPGTTQRFGERPHPFAVCKFISIQAKAHLAFDQRIVVICVQQIGIIVKGDVIQERVEQGRKILLLFFSVYNSEVTRAFLVAFGAVGQAEEEGRGAGLKNAVHRHWSWMADEVNGGAGLPQA